MSRDTVGNCVECQEYRAQIALLEDENRLLRDTQGAETNAALRARLDEALRLGHEMVEKGHAQEARLAEAERLLREWQDATKDLWS